MFPIATKERVLAHNEHEDCFPEREGMKNMLKKGKWVNKHDQCTRHEDDQDGFSAVSVSQPAPETGRDGTENAHESNDT